MRVLIVHNLYQQPGGEEVVAEREGALLAARGHDVVNYRRSNAELDRLSPLGKLALPARMIWSEESVRQLRSVIRDYRPDVAHFHNTFMMITPAAYYLCAGMGVPVIQSMHNPRLMCPAASFYREGALCTECLGRPFAYPGVLHGCYRHSRAQTAAVATMIAAHRAIGTWQTRVHAYVAFTDFYRHLFVQAGLPPERLYVKPHFVSPDPGERTTPPSDYALFAGRLDPQKGVRTLLKAWRDLRGIPLKIAGAGQLLPEVQEAIEQGAEIEVVGWVGRERLIELVKGARFLVWPSEGWFETFGLVAVEAFACGVPVIGSKTGVMEEIVRDGETGLHFEAGNAEDLTAKVRWAWEHPDELLALGRGARREFESKYAADANYDQLMAIYVSARAQLARDGGT